MAGVGGLLTKATWKPAGSLVASVPMGHFRYAHDSGCEFYLKAK